MLLGGPGGPVVDILLPGDFAAPKPALLPRFSPLTFRATKRPNFTFEIRGDRALRVAGVETLALPKTASPLTYALLGGLAAVACVAAGYALSQYASRPRLVPVGKRR